MIDITKRYRISHPSYAKIEVIILAEEDRNTKLFKCVPRSCPNCNPFYVQEMHLVEVQES
jgi:hypothetical protein